VAAGEFGALLAHIDLQLLDQGPAVLPANCPALFGTLAVDPALDLEQGVDAAHDLDRDRREHDRAPACGPPPGVLRNVGHGEEWTPSVHLIRSST